MRDSKTFRLFAAAVCMTLGLTACGGGAKPAPAGSGTPAPAPAPAPAKAPELKGLVKPGTIILATSGNFPPFTFIGADGKVQGYSVDVMAEVAKRLNLQLENQTVDFVAELQGLLSGKYDVADSGIWPTKERQGQMLFTIPVASTGFVATVKADNNSVKGLDDLKGRKVGAVQGSTREQWLLQNKDKLGYASYLGYQGASQAVADLFNGRIDLIVDDPLLAYYYIQQNPGKVKTAGAVGQEHSLALALRKGTEDVQSAVNKVLADMKKDGTLEKLQVKYWGHRIPTPDDINQEGPYK